MCRICGETHKRNKNEIGKKILTLKSGSVELNWKNRNAMKKKNIINEMKEKKKEILMEREESKIKKNYAIEDKKMINVKATAGNITYIL